jgi:lipopolysaccharide export system permease protein
MMAFSLTLSRYVARLFLFWFGIVCAVFGFILTLVDVAELFRRTAGKVDVTFAVVLKMAILRFPSLFQEILPFAIFFTGLIFLWRLNRAQEIIVLRAGGYSVWQLLTMPLILSLGIGLGDLFVFGPIAAQLRTHYQRYEDRLIHGKPDSLSISETGVWLREQLPHRHTIIRFSHIDPGHHHIHTVTVYDFSPSGQFLQRVDAARGRLDPPVLTLEKPWTTELGQPSRPDQRPFERVTTITQEAIKTSFNDPKNLSFWSLPGHMTLMERLGLSSLSYRIQWHTLLSRVFWMLGMMLLAACFTLTPPRFQGRIPLIGLSLATAFILFIYKDVTAAMGLSGRMPLFLAAWAPTLTTIFIAVTGLLHAEEG